MTQFDWPPRPLPSLDAAIRDVRSQKAAFRRNAAIALGRAPADRAREAREALIALVEDPDRSVRIEAVYAATSLGATEHADAIAALLSIDDPDLRIAALEFASATGQKTWTERILAMGERDDETTVRCMALEALAELSPSALVKAMEAVARDDAAPVPLARTALSLMRSHMRDSDPDLAIARLGDPRPGVSLEAAATLAHLGDGRAVERLFQEAVSPASAEDRTLAMQGLCRVPDAAVRNHAARRLTSLIATREEKAYWAAILAAAGDAAALDTLTQWVKGTDPLRAALAMQAAGLCSVEPLVEALEAMAMGSGDGPVTESIEALGLMRTGKAALALERIADAVPDRAGHARAALEEVLGWMRS